MRTCFIYLLVLSFKSILPVVRGAQHVCLDILETQWKKAIPAKQRIREIEDGAKREVVEIIRDPFEMQRIRYDLIKSAKKKY